MKLRRPTRRRRHDAAQPRQLDLAAGRADEGAGEGSTEGVVVGEEAAGGNGTRRRWIALAAGRRDCLIGQTVAGSRAVNGTDGRVGRSEGPRARVDEAVVDVVFSIVGGTVVETAISASLSVATQMPYFAALDAHFVALDERAAATRAFRA